MLHAVPTILQGLLPSMNDMEQLVAQAKKCDSLAQHALYSRYKQRAISVCRRITRNPDGWKHRVHHFAHPGSVRPRRGRGLCLRLPCGPLLPCLPSAGARESPVHREAPLPFPHAVARACCTPDKDRSGGTVGLQKRSATAVCRLNCGALHRLFMGNTD